MRSWHTKIILLLMVTMLSCSQPSRSLHLTRIERASRVDMPAEIIATGKLRPQVGAEVNVGPRISGGLRTLCVRVGDEVTAGQLLAELDHTDLDVAVREADAVLNEAEAQRDLTAGQLRRRQALGREGLISADDLAIVQTAASLAVAQRDRARAQVEATRIARGYAEITAPIAGTVTAIATQQGETVAARFAVPTFVTIMDLTRLQLEAYVDEVDIGRVSVGQSAQFSVDAFPQESFEAKVNAVIPQAKLRDNVVNYTVILAITGGEKEVLRPDMSASVTITTGSEHAVLVLPSRAIQRDSEGRAFVLVEETHRHVRRDVSIGEVRGNQVQIRSGLREGDQVVFPKADGGPQ